MLKAFSLIFLACFSICTLRATGTTLVLPPILQTEEGDVVEGLAIALAVHDQLAREDLLIPFTAVRKKLESMKLPITGPVTLASQFRIAEYLGGLKILRLQDTPEQVELTSYDVNARFLLSRYSVAQAEADFSSKVRMMINDLTTKPVEMDEGHVAYYRVWASAYLAPDRQTMQEIMDRLLQTPFANWLLLQEYVDLFGDPAEDQDDVDSMAYWRDFYLERNYFEGSYASSVKVMEMRHNPSDYITHARILIALGDEQQACDYLKKAEGFGFDLGDLQDRYNACMTGP